ncbi:MAG: hypothetical protein U0X20_07365 [Caldilineaceae bacterium]
MPTQTTFWQVGADWGEQGDTVERAPALRLPGRRADAAARAAGLPVNQREHIGGDTVERGDFTAAPRRPGARPGHLEKLLAA